MFGFCEAPCIQRGVSFFTYIADQTTIDMDRRKFISDTGMAAAAAGFISVDTNQNQPMLEKNIFIHHVYFWLKNKDSKEDLQKLIRGLEKLSKIDYFKSFHIGVPASTNREVVDSTYAVSWMVIFKNAADQEKYQSDPVHLKFIDECSALWERVVVYDTVDY